VKGVFLARKKETKKSSVKVDPISYDAHTHTFLVL